MLRIGEAAELLGVGVETVRRWDAEGRLRTDRSRGRQRLVPLSEVRRLLAERRRGRDARAPRQSARNRLPGVVTRVERDRLTAVVEVLAGPHRLVSMMTREAADELGLEPGRRVVCVVKATQLMVETDD